MIPTLTIDTRAFNGALQQIARYSGVALEKVIEAEAGKVLEAAIRATPAARVAKIRARVETQEVGYYDAGNGRKRYYLKNKYPDAIWAKISAARKASLAAKLKARGLSKRSWADLAAALGMTIIAPAFVSNAAATTGKRYNNATARRETVRGRVGLYFENRQPTVQLPSVGGRRALLRAINGREKYFRKNLESGVFSDLKKIAQAYPGLKLG